MTDKNFRPCKCGYQICLFCYNKIKDNHNGACPACRHARAHIVSHSATLWIPPTPHSPDVCVPFTGHRTMRPMPSLLLQTLLSAFLSSHATLRRTPQDCIRNPVSLCPWAQGICREGAIYPLRPHMRAVSHVAFSLSRLCSWPSRQSFVVRRGHLSSYVMCVQGG